MSTAGSGPLASRDNALTLHVEDIAGMTIEIVTLRCAGDCADVEAVARGGNPPYSFAWEDGSTAPARRVCLDASRQLTVRATDTEIETVEFEYEARTVTAVVTATVLDCTDGGMPGPDAATPTSTCGPGATPVFRVMGKQESKLTSERRVRDEDGRLGRQPDPRTRAWSRPSRPACRASTPTRPFPTRSRSATRRSRST